MPKWIMTDDAKQFYTAWISVFGQGPNKLLCTCHVDRAWRGAVKNKIQEKEVALIYHNLRVLMGVDAFEELLKKQLSNN